MNNSPFFSIIIPTYNRAHTIAHTINSCIQQNFFDYEIIVVDDGSTDNTFEIVSPFITKYKIQYHKKLNEERATARNYGIDMARGKYVTFLDSDDVLYSDFLTNAFEKITTNNYPEFVILAYEICTLDNRTKSRIKYKNDINILVEGNPLSCIGNFLKREITNEYRFNEDKSIIRSEDWELWIRVAARYGFIHDNRISSCVYDHEERSVRNFDTEQLIRHKYQAITSAFNDKYVKELFEVKERKIYAYCDTYISLHLALAGKKKKAIRFLLSGIRKYPGVVFTRRFLAIIKRILLFR
jgi:glycosyltransferase involved in cell wall biosynthesis